MTTFTQQQADELRAHIDKDSEYPVMTLVRSDVRSMLDEIERQAKEIATLRAELQAMRDDENPNSMRVVVECDGLDQPIGTCRLTGEHFTVGCLVPIKREGWLILDDIDRDLTDADP